MQLAVDNLQAADAKRWRRSQLLLVGKAIAAALPRGATPLERAMRYAAKGPGKRLRPLLCLAAAGRASARAVRAACAVELAHCYSLVHDDLPCMDDDDLRRGRQSCHVRYGEDIALLAGDALQSLGVAELAGARLGDEALSIYANAIGVHGMAGGQAADLAGQARTVRALSAMHKRKTGALIAASLQLGAIAGGASSSTRRLLAQLGTEFGLCFQIADDIIDETGSVAEHGKSIGKDRRDDRATYVTVLGLDNARRQLNLGMRRLASCLARLPGDNSRLDWLCRSSLPRLPGQA